MIEDSHNWTLWPYLHPAEDETRGEPEPTDVYAEQGEADWLEQPRSDDLLGEPARRALLTGWT